MIETTRARPLCVCGLYAHGTTSSGTVNAGLEDGVAEILPSGDQVWGEETMCTRTRWALDDLRQRSGLFIGQPAGADAEHPVGQTRS